MPRWTKVLAIFWALSPASAQAQWSPSKPVEFVVMAGPTGSSAKAVQTIVDIIQKNALAPISLQIVYKEEHSGADGLQHVIKATDPDHTLIISSTSYFAIAARHRDIGAEVALFTPVAAMGLDVFMIWVPASRQDITDLTSLMQAASNKKKTTGQNWVMAGFGEESTDGLLTGYLSITHQADIKYLPNSSGGEAAKALLEGRADSSISTPAVQNENHRTGKVKPVVVFSQNPPEQYAAIPRYAETDKKFSIEVPRMVVGPKGMSLEAQSYYVHLFNKVFKSPEWEAYRQKKRPVRQVSDRPRAGGS
jgi:putative tricarboxylic transport membrane protein